jgi:hypothetical protein
VEELLTKPILAPHTIGLEAGSLEKCAVSPVSDLRKSSALVAVLLEVDPRRELIEVVELNPGGEDVPSVMKRILCKELRVAAIRAKLLGHRYVDRSEVAERGRVRTGVRVDRRIYPVEVVRVACLPTEGNDVWRSAREIVPVEPCRVSVDIVGHPGDRVLSVKLNNGFMDEVLGGKHTDTHLEIVGPETVPREVFFKSFQWSDVHVVAGKQFTPEILLDESSPTCDY